MLKLKHSEEMPYHKYEHVCENEYDDKFMVVCEFDETAAGEIISVHPIDDGGWVDHQTDVKRDTEAYNEAWLEEVREHCWDAYDYDKRSYASDLERE